jgi:UDP-N-acetylmuramoyl-L-alanyl-D-glutamate--2,6-diaminopimelate ligase
LKELSKLLASIEVIQIVGDKDKPVSDITLDSRNVINNGIFVAVKGTSTDGHLFIDNAIDSGATCIVCESLPVSRADITYIKVEDASVAVGQLAAAFFGFPSHQCKVIGITGTNGKTTTATLLFDLYTELGYKSGLISTVEVRIGQEREEATHTTPDPVNLQRLLKRMTDDGCTHIFMEVSSHAVDQNRIAGIRFEGGVFTNISHDHLDYHKTFDAYIKAKKKFFDSLEKEAFALVNADDKRGEIMIQNCRSVKRRYGLKTPADFKGRILNNSIDGLHLIIDEVEVYTRMIGDYNAYNLLAAYGTAICEGQSPDEVLRILSMLQGAKGRFEYIYDPERQIAGVVDYAHTPDALEKVMSSTRKMLNAGNRLLTVVGCGGDRDRTKRPIMGKIAMSTGFPAILTSDNPRSESPEAILEDMVADLSEDEKKKCIVITDRKIAIQTAVQMAQPGDIVLVAGKGHETYQEINGVKYPFDDLKILKEMLGIIDAR